MDRCTDVVELLVEHATDFRMCDLLDDNFAAAAAGGLAGSSNKYNARKSGSDAVALGLIPGAYANIIYRQTLWLQFKLKRTRTGGTRWKRKSRPPVSAL